MNLLHFGFKVKDIERAMHAYGDLLGIKWDPVSNTAQRTC